VADKAVFGLSQFTGSEEGRGPLFDITRVPFEGDHLPAGSGTQGDKIAAPIPLDVPTAVPLMALRVGDRMIVSIPGEMTAEMGRRVRHAVMYAARGSGVHRAVISGLANEYADYFTTPQEYDAQHYEGGATVYGRTSSVALEETLADLTSDLVNGRPGPKPYIYDPRNGVRENAAPFPQGAASATVEDQPDGTARRLEHPAFAWQGGPRGFDRPLDRAFVAIQRRSPDGAWHTVDSDLGLDVLWTVDANGRYRAEWEPCFNRPLGTYRFGVTANRYSLSSAPFELLASRALAPRRVVAPPGKVAVVLDYPPAEVHEHVGEPAPDANASLTDRPPHVNSGLVTFIVDGKQVTVGAANDGRFEVSAAPGQVVAIPAGAARDRYGNRNRDHVTLVG
jgi:hypothetical protein